MTFTPFGSLESTESLGAKAPCVNLNQPSPPSARSRALKARSKMMTFTSLIPPSPPSARSRALKVDRFSQVEYALQAFTPFGSLESTESYTDAVGEPNHPGTPFTPFGSLESTERDGQEITGQRKVAHLHPLRLAREH